MPSKLLEYEKKKNLQKSGEPKAKLESSKLEKSKSKEKIFVIQEHNASHLHWDFRLEINRTLKSWAIPKIPDAVNDGKTKRLAIQVEDHPLSYAKFEGEIKEGYGKGTVKIFDKGTYELKSHDDKKIEFKLHGKKLKGDYVLIKTNYGKTEEQKNKSWLFFKI